MLGSEIKLLIVDFDGTLVDTFRANFMAYQEAFNQVGLALKEVDYRHCFDPVVTQKISEFKGNCYPDFFRYFKVNNSLLAILKTFHNAGGKTAIASTACRKNLEKALQYIEVTDIFDLILAGEEVRQGKPSPEIYRTVLRHFSMQPNEALVFEDSEVGVQAAQSAGINYIVVNSNYYGD